MRKLSSKLSFAFSLVVVLSIPLFGRVLIGCTKQEVDTAVAGGTDVCEVILYAKDPALEPICASAQEVEAVVEAVVLAIEKSGAAKRTPTRDELYQMALKMGVPTLKGAAAKAVPKCKPVQGQVSP